MSNTSERSSGATVQRGIDKSDPDHTGAPKRMSRKCLNCGYYRTHGCVTVWLDVEDGRSHPRDDVSFKCLECDEVSPQQIKILERWPGSDE
jgi:hypothetical protein